MEDQGHIDNRGEYRHLLVRAKCLHLYWDAICSNYLCAFLTSHTFTLWSEMASGLPTRIRVQAM